MVIKDEAPAAPYCAPPGASFFDSSMSAGGIE